MTDNTAARVAVLETNTARALDEIATLRGHIEQVLAQTGCTLADNIKTDRAMREQFKAEQIERQLAEERKRARAEARRDLAAGIGILSGLIGLAITIGGAARVLWPNGPWGWW